MNEIETSGFYRENNGEIQFAPNFVLSSVYELRKETHEQHTYPVDGWSWFNSEAEAKLFFKINS
jgi:hypothetical protein